MIDRTDDETRAATQAAIDYLYRNPRDDPEFQLTIMAALVKSNGCTMAPDFCFKRCCERHDVEYRTGLTIFGKPIKRSESDAKLMACIDTMAQEGEKDAQRALAPIYYAFVRVLGESHWIYWTPPVFEVGPTD